MEAVDDEEDTIDVVDQISVGFLLTWSFLPFDFLGAAQFYAALSRQYTPLSALTPSSSASPNKRPATPSSIKL